MPITLPTEAELLDIIAREAQIERETLSRDFKLADAGIASIEIINILFVIEDRYGVNISERELAGSQTMGELLDHLFASLKGAG